MPALIRLSPECLTRDIFRIISFDSLKDLIFNRRSFLQHPTNWEDSYENSILRQCKQLFQTPDRDVDKHFYGQCWSLKPESDAIWKIFSPKADGVKIQTTINKINLALPEECNLENGDALQGEWFIGKMKYLARTDFDNRFYNEEFLTSELIDHESQATSLLFKRDSYDFEKEIRILFRSNDLVPDSIVFFYFDFNSLIEKFEFHPRMPDDTFSNAKNTLVQLGISENKISRSRHFEPPIFDSPSGRSD